MKIVLKNVRLAFGQGLFTPSSMEGSEPKFGSTFIFAKDHPAAKTMQDAIQQVATEKWGAKAPEILKSLKAGGKLCLRDGDIKANFDGFAGNLFVSSSNRARPTVLDRDKTPLTQQDGKPYSGCYVNVSLDLWSMDNKFGRRVNATLLAVQFASDGEAFSGGAAFSDDDFETIEGGDGDGLFD